MLLAPVNGEIRASVCLMMKSVLSLNSSRNNSYVDDVPGPNLAAPLFSLWMKWIHKLVRVFSSPHGR